MKEVYIPSTVTKIGSQAFGYLDAAGGNKLMEDFTILGKAGSAAQAYAKANGIPFREVTEVLHGDVNGDGFVTIGDVTIIQQKLADMPTASFNEKAADVDGNGSGISDATAIQRYLAEFDDPYYIGEFVAYNTKTEYELPFIAD